MEEIDVTKMVYCPDQNETVECDDCIGCEYYHGMGDNEYTLKCGFEDGEELDE